VAGVGVGLQDVLALDVDALEPPGDGRVEHVGDAQARLRVDGTPQTGLEALAAGRRRRCGGSR
jgi:hypothetical protein